MTPEDKCYLGDGVYVALERGLVRLTAENGLEVQDTVYLDDDTLRSLLDWLQAWGMVTWQPGRPPTAP